MDKEYKITMKGNRAVGLLEMLLVLAIMAVIATSGIGYLKQKTEKIKVDATVSQMHTILRAQQEYFDIYHTAAPNIAALAPFLPDKSLINNCPWYPSGTACYNISNTSSPSAQGTTIDRFVVSITIPNNVQDNVAIAGKIGAAFPDATLSQSSVSVTEVANELPALPTPPPPPPPVIDHSDKVYAIPFQSGKAIQGLRDCTALNPDTTKYKTMTELYAVAPFEIPKSSQSTPKFTSFEYIIPNYYRAGFCPAGTVTPIIGNPCTAAPTAACYASAPMNTTSGSMKNPVPLTSISGKLPTPYICYDNIVMTAIGSAIDRPGPSITTTVQPPQGIILEHCSYPEISSP